MNRSALIIGNSDGIGLALTEKLLEQEWQITGISRSKSRIRHPYYRHWVTDVRDTGYPETIEAVLNEYPATDLCIYCPGIGELLDLSSMKDEENVFEVNLIGMVRTAVKVVPKMVKQGRGHFIGLSSVADEMLSGEAPSYHASKAAFSNYLEGLALALKPKGVSVTNIRFGFVDTKMAKGDVKPFMLTVDRAVKHVFRCMEKKPVRYTAPKIVIPLVKFRSWMLRLKII